MKTVWKTLLTVAACGSLFAGTAFAQVTPAAGFTPPDDTPTFKVGMTLYPLYTFQHSPKATDVDGNSISPNNFDVGRSYLNFTGNIRHDISFRITPDITRATPSGSGGTTLSLANSLTFRIKYAFAQFSLDDHTKNWKQTWVRIGANQTPFVDWEEGVYRYRFQGTVFSERVGKLTSSDYGVSFHTNLPNNYGEIHTGIYNGEGYSSVEATSAGASTNQKAVQTRITIRPFATGPMVARGLRLTSFYDWDHVVKDAPRNRLVLMALFEHPHVVAGFDFMDARDQASTAAVRTRGNGYSAWATPIFKQKGSGPEMLLRYDSYIKDRTKPTEKQNTTIIGLSYWFPHQGTVSTALMADVEAVKFAGTATPAQRRLYVHGYLNF